MSGSYLDSVPVNAGADLSDLQYRVVTVGGTLAPTATTALGILQNKPESGEDATVGFAGRSRYRAGGAVTAGNRLTSTASGWTVACGSNEIGFGTALGDVASGGIGEAIINFAGVKTEVISGHLA